MSDQGKSRQPIYRECRARWAFGKGNNGKLRILRSETKAETDHDSTEQNEHTVRQGQANTRVFAGGKQKERASVMKGKLNGFIEYGENHFDLKECKNIIAVFETKDGAKNIAFGEFNWLEMAKAIYSLNKTIIEETLKLQEDASASLKYIEALLDVNKKKEQV